MSEELECTCIYGMDEAGRQGLLSKRPYCPLHDKDAHERREYMASLHYAERGGMPWAWSELADEERGRWRTWAEIELEYA